MGSFAGVSIDAQNLQQAVSLAEQKKILAEQTRLYQLSQSLTDYRNSLPTMVSDVKIAMPQYGFSNNFSQLVQKPYLILQDFIVYSDQTDKKGNVIGQHQHPQQKNTVVFLPVGSIIGNQFQMQNQYDIALKDGKLKPLDIVTVESLVDKQEGYCQKVTPSEMMQMVYRPPCISVSKGEMLKGYIISGTFTPYDDSGFQNKKPVLSFNEFKVFNSNDKSKTIEDAIETKRRNENKTKIIIISAFILGYLLSND
jgi:hypothetical protein